MGFPGSPVGKESSCNVEDPGWIPGLGRSRGEGIRYPLQYSWTSPVAQVVMNLPGDLAWIPGLGISSRGGHDNYFSILVWKIPKDRGAWRAAVHGVTKSRTGLSN